jgi:hypothetical protein
MIHPLLKTEAKTWANVAVFETQLRAFEMKSKQHPLTPWTPGHRLMNVIATPDSLMTYDEANRCPSSWTPDHWMNDISQILGTTYDEPTGVQVLPTAMHPCLLTFAGSSPKLHNRKVKSPSGLSVAGTLRVPWPEVWPTP